jgi:hypothetical protein
MFRAASSAVFAALCLVVSTSTAAGDEARDDDARQTERHHLAAGKTHNLQAHDHARLLGKYAGASDRASAEIVKGQTAAIRASAQAAKKSFAKVGQTAPDNRELAARVAQLQERLDQVTELSNRLESQLRQPAVDSRTAAEYSSAVSELLRANHASIKQVDQDFYNSQSDSYYSTGEGHFVD